MAARAAGSAQRSATRRASAASSAARSSARVGAGAGRALSAAARATRTGAWAAADEVGTGVAAEGSAARGVGTALGAGALRARLTASSRWEISRAAAALREACRRSQTNGELACATIAFCRAISAGLVYAEKGRPRERPRRRPYAEGKPSARGRRSSSRAARGRPAGSRGQCPQPMRTGRRAA